MDEKARRAGYMRRALSLAKRGMGKVNPNPMVGAVVVRGGRVVGEGYHRVFGGAHAEVEALEKAGRAAKGAELFVTLEPCNHHGKTPPCTESIRAAGVKGVYLATEDPNPLVKGKGISALKERGIDVHAGICEAEARALNRMFFTCMESKRPFVSLKMAVTADGFIADQRGESRWITSEASRRHGHLLRARHDAVAVGIGTVKRDDPSLNVRIKGRYRQPIRVVVDHRFEADPLRNIFNDKGGEVVLFTSAIGGRGKDFSKAECRPTVIEYGEKRNLHGVLLSTLRGMGATSLLVEGGAGMLSLFLEGGIVDRLYIFMAPKLFGRGLSPFEHVPGLGVGSPYPLSIEKIRKMDDDILIEAVPVRRPV